MQIANLSTTGQGHTAVHCLWLRTQALRIPLLTNLKGAKKGSRQFFFVKSNNINQAIPLIKGVYS